METTRRRLLIATATLSLLLTACGAGPSLSDVVDKTRTSPYLLEESEAPDGMDFALVTALTHLTYEEVLVGMLSAAEGATGTSVWYYNGPLGEFYLYIWPGAFGCGGYSLVSTTNMIHENVVAQMGLGNNASMMEIADLIRMMKEIGYVKIENPATNLPPRWGVDMLGKMLEAVPTMAPIWALLQNGIFFTFPEAMFYFAPARGGNS